MNVTKANGELVPLDIREIQEKTQSAAIGLENVYSAEVEVDSQIQFFDGITTEEITKSLIKTAVDKIDIDKPNYSFFAARLVIKDLAHKVGRTLGGIKGNAYSPLSTYLEFGESKGKIIIGLKDKFDLNDLDRTIQPKRDLLFTYLGIKTLYDRYILKTEEGDPFEMPQHLFMAVSMFVAQREENPLSMDKDSRKEYEKLSLNEKDQKKFVRTYWAKKFYNILSKFEVMAATPTLSNARTPRHQLSSCYIGSTPDSIEGIFDVYSEQALLSKFGGGIGWDWSNVRGISSMIDGTKNAAGGIVPFLKIENDVALAVDQLGTRKGAIAVYIETWHIDIMDFLSLKKNSGEERRRAHDLFPALWINDIFMERVEKDQEWTLFSPENVPGLTDTYGEEFNKLYQKYEEDKSIPRQEVMAKDIWKEALRQYFETGNPFLTFKDRANAVNPNKHAGIIRSTNLCTEIFQNTSPNKYLIEIEYEDGSKESYEEEVIITTDAGDKKPAKKVSSIDTINGKNVFYVGKEKIDGDTAVCNLASMNLSKINTKEDIERVVPIATRFLDNVIELNFYPHKKTKMTNLKTRAIGFGVMGEAQMLAESKIMYGSQEHFERIDEVMEIFSYNVIKASSELGKEKGSYPQFEGSEWSKGIFPQDNAKDNVKELTTRKHSCDWEGLKKKVKKDGMRNGYLMAIAPTSSISILTGTTQAIEPVFKRFWREENLSGVIPVVAPNLSPETWVYYPTAYELDQLKLITAGAIRQKWLDQGQSLNVFIDLSTVTGKKLHNIYMTAWKYGLKSTYYLRSQAPKALEEEDDEVEDRSQECSGCQ